MRKIVLAVAAATLACGTMAADVTVYGIVDSGLHFVKQKDDNNDTKTTTFDMKSGANSASRIGLKGVEEIADGLKVGFVLENGFKSDTGALGDDSRLFDREALLYVETRYGKIGAGRFGGLGSGTGSFNINQFSSFGIGGWGDYTGKNYYSGDTTASNRFDNSIAYVSPRFYGFQISAMYSNGASGDDAVKSTAKARYAGLGATYAQGPLTVGLILETVDPVKKDNRLGDKQSINTTLGASYDFGVTKLFGLAQYGKNMKNFAGVNALSVPYEDDSQKKLCVANGSKSIEGFSLALGHRTPLLGGTLIGQINYADGKQTFDQIEYYEQETLKGSYSVNGKIKIKKMGIGVGYEYALSKRTKLYGAVSHSVLKTTLTNMDTAKVKTSEVIAGLVHSF